MRNLEIVFVNKTKLESKLRQLKGNMTESKEELRSRLDGLHRSLSTSIQHWRQYHTTGTHTSATAIVLELKHKGFHPHLLSTALTR